MPWDPNWDEVFKVHPWGKYPSEDVIRFIARNFYKVADRKSVKILEIGCGTGANLWYLAKELFCSYGVDGSATAIAICRKRMDIEVPGWCGELRVCDVRNLPYSENSFDAVIDVECVYANVIEDAKRIYGEVERVLKPGGRLFSKTFAAGSVGDGTGACIGHHAWLVADGPLVGMGTSRFTEESEIHELLAPLDVISIDRTSRSEQNQRMEIAEWLTISQKQQRI